jgi:hypothetical protein
VDIAARDPRLKSPPDERIPGKERLLLCVLRGYAAAPPSPDAIGAMRT